MVCTDAQDLLTFKSLLNKDFEKNNLKQVVENRNINKGFLYSFKY